MKTRIRHRNKSEDTTHNLDPMIRLGFIVTVFFAIFGGFLIENHPTLYLVSLFLIFPVFCIGYGIFQKIEASFSMKFRWYALALLINFFFLLLYIFTLKGFFLFIFIVCCGLMLFINYIPYLENKHQKRIIKNKQQAKYKSMFNRLLEDKNFLHHHNYYNSPKLKEIYMQRMRKNTIKSFLITSCILPIFIGLGGIESLVQGEISFGGFITMISILFFIIIFARVLTYLIKFMSGKLNSDKVSIYQKKIDVENHLSYKKKIFFY